MSREEAQCPKCQKWAPISWCPLNTDDCIDEHEHYCNGYASSCPYCGELLLIETECNLRDSSGNDAGEHRDSASDE